MRLAFLWHLHQPDYRDASGVMQMPWVFLHAIKDYYDMPWMLSRHPGLKATFNITPPLIEQLGLYRESPETKDRFLGLWLRPVATLGETDREWMIKLCRSVNVDTMAAALPHYGTLRQYTRYEDGQLRDLQILFMLAWCGVSLRRQDETVQGLIARGSGFDEGDKAALFSVLVARVERIFSYFISLHDAGHIALSTTPLNHPILPLLLDMQNAEQAHNGTNLPRNALSLETDARVQVERAQALFRETFGFDAAGFWPAEGAVDEASLRLYRACGLKWVATDEAILFKSLGTDTRSALYRPWSFEGVTMGFRDHGLSDLIGFTYRFWDAPRAAEHFMNAIRPIHDAGEDQTLFIILDGENAWEFYANNAFDFFEELYGRLASSSWCETVTMDAVAAQPAEPLAYLAPGSWIHGEFNTWVGHPEKTRAWELLFSTRRDYEHHAAGLDTATKAKIQHHFLAAECSDWFWWYGDDHYTEFSEEFDRLFRAHLIAVYDLMRTAPMADLLLPILSDKGTQDFMSPPQSRIVPTVNGRHDSFFEWVGAGVIDETRLFSTMDRERGPVSRLRFGEDGGSIYIALDAEAGLLEGCELLHVYIDPPGCHITIDLLELRQQPLTDTTCGVISLQAAFSEWIELELRCHEGCEALLELRFELERGGSIAQTLPGFGALKVERNAHYAENWFV